MKYKTILLMALLAFGITLAIIVGQRLSAEAMAVIVGVVAGVAASIPTSLIVVWIATRERPAQVGTTTQHSDDSAAPRVVVVHAAPQMAQPAYPYGNPYQQPQSHAFAPSYSHAFGSPPLAAPRTFTVIGGETLEDCESQ